MTGQALGFVARGVRVSSAIGLFPRSSLLASGLTEDTQKNKLIKVKCAAAMQSLVDHKWEWQNQWQPFCRQRPEAWATGGMEPVI